MTKYSCLGITLCGIVDKYSHSPTYFNFAAYVLTPALFIFAAYNCIELVL